MIDKQIVNENLDEIYKIITLLGNNEEIEKKTKELNEASKEFLIKILTIGSFSAGKSALINFLLDDAILKEEQTPETAIATELAYKPMNSYEVVKLDKSRNYVNFDDLHQITPEDYLNIRCNLDNKFLKKFEDYIFVDMPGFNSNLEQHNRAIMQYIDKGNAYLLVIDCEDGGLKASAIEFIEEVRKYEQNLIIVLSKVDKKSVKDIEMIEERIKEQAAYLFGYEIPVVKYSKHDHDTKQEIINTIQQIDSQIIFEQAMIPQLKEIYDYLELALEQTMASLTFDDSELKKEIHKKEKAKSELEAKLQQERSKLTARMNTQVLPGVLNSVESALYNHSDELTDAAIISTQVFNTRVNSILRPVLLENTNKYTNHSFEEFLQEINISDLLLDTTEDVIGNMANKLHKVESAFKQSDKLPVDFNKLYKSVTGTLAIVTTVVAPWLELLIIFLPEILQVFGVGGEKSKKNKVKSSIEAQIIPQIIEKLNPIIKDSLAEMEELLINELEDKLKSIITVEEQALQEAIKKKDELQYEYEEQIEKYGMTLNLVREKLQILNR